MIMVVLGAGFYIDTGMRKEANDLLGYAEPSKEINLLKAYFRQ